MSKKNNLKNRAEKEQREKAIQDRKFDVYKSKKEEVQFLREKKEELKKIKKKNTKVAEKNNQKNKFKIKMEEERAAEQRRIRDLEVKESSKFQTQLKIEEEKQRIEELESEAHNLEIIEQELLQKLQSTQMMEKDAFAELEKAMIASSENRRQKSQK